MKAVIFGANGQDGFYLKEKCLQRKIEPILVSRSNGNVRADVSSYELVKNIIQENKPNYIFHLAANSTTRHDAIFENYETITTGTLNILEATKKFCPHAKVFITGSGLQFVNNNQPISEHDPFDSNNSYSMARIQSVYTARYYRKLGIACYVGYLFHHESPYRKKNHISKIIISFLQEVIEGSKKKLTLGDISVKKEWTFAGDIAEAIMILVEQDNVYESVIGSGLAYSIKDWLNLSFNSINKKWEDYVILHDNFIPEYKLLVSNPNTIKNLGWEQKVSFEELNKMMLSN